MSRELSKKNIRINLISPGNILFSKGNWEKRIEKNIFCLFDSNVDFRCKSFYAFLEVTLHFGKCLQYSSVTFVFRCIYVC